MKENICTIPINDIFREHDGCPVCRMYRMAEEQYVEFITGAAMMAPDVRVRTNEVGFCRRHLEQMIAHGPRLSVALLLQTHLDEIRSKHLPKRASSSPSKSDLDAIRALSRSCYVCDRIEHDVLHLMRTVYAQYGIDEEFRRLYAQQDCICMEHYPMVISGATKKSVDKKYLNDFIEATNTLAMNKINELYDDVTFFTTLFDYRNAGADPGKSKDSIERAADFLTPR